MSAFGVIQAVVIGVLVLGSALYALRKLLPGLSTRWLAAASASLNKPWRKPWLRQLPMCFTHHGRAFFSKIAKSCRRKGI